MAVVVRENRGDGRPGTPIAMIGRSTAENAVVGREHEPQLRHPATEAGRRLDQIDFEARVIKWEAVD